MKRILITILVALLLIGCGRTVSNEVINFEAEISALEQHTLDFATGGGNIEEFRTVIEEFNVKLSEINTKDDRVVKYSELQQKANELRLEGFEDMDYDKITESTALQAEAIEIYNEIKDAN